MTSTARSAVISFDAALIVLAMNPLASGLCGGGSWHGRPLADCLDSFARFAPGEPGSPERRIRDSEPALRRYLAQEQAFTLLVGTHAWRAELIAFSSDAATQAAGVLSLREAGDAEDYRDLPLDRIDFRAALSHDLRTPLNAMAGWVHLLAMAQPDPPEMVARALAGLRRAIDRQRELISERVEPLAAGPATPAAAPADGNPDSASPCLRGCHVLAVDDNPDLLDVLSILLAAEGAIVTTAVSAEQALDHYPAWAGRGGERMLISDLAMPGRDGMSLIRAIRTLELHRRLPRLPAVALSAHGQPEIRRQAIENGFDLFLDKPINPPVLLRKLCRLVDRG